MEKILKIDKMFSQKILSHDQNILFNHSTKLLINIISNNIKEIISEYHFLDFIELKQFKNDLVINLLKLKNKNYYYFELTNICDELIQMVEEINYPFGITNSLINYNNSLNNYDNLKKNINIKFYHKPSSHIYQNLKGFDLSSDSDSDMDDEYTYWDIQRKFIKNNLSNNLIDNNMLSSIMKINKKNILNKNTLTNKKTNINFININSLKKEINTFDNKKENSNKIINMNNKKNGIFTKKKIPKEYKIISKNISFDWEKSFISI
jgi:hypothetical protein